MEILQEWEMEEIVFQSCFPWNYFVALQGEK